MSRGSSPLPALVVFSASRFYGVSVAEAYFTLVRFSSIEQNHLVRLLEELFNRTAALHSISDARNPTAADASTLLGTGSVSLLNSKSFH